MSVSKRGPKWIVTIYDQGQKRKRWIGTYDTRGEARDAESEALLDRRRKYGNSELVEDFQARWTVDYARPKQSTNLHNAERTSHFARDFKGRTLDSITRKEARGWVLDNRGCHSAVRAMFSDAKRDGLCEDNPFTAMRLTGRRTTDIVVPTSSDVNRLVEQAEAIWGAWGQQVYGPMITFAAYTGLRAGELHALRWDDIDEPTRTIRVERQYNHKVNQFTPPKNGLTRTAFLSPQAEQALELVPRIRREVFSTPQGKMFTGRVSAYYWHQARAGVNPSLRFHDLRHYYGTYLADRGIAPRDIAEALGHTDGGVLAMRVYCHADADGSRARVAAAFGAQVKPVEEMPQLRRQA